MWQRVRAHNHLACIENWEAIYLVDLGEDEYAHWRDAASIKTDHWLAVPQDDDRIMCLSEVPMLDAVPLDLDLAVDVLVPAVVAVPKGKRLRKPKRKRAARSVEDAADKPQEPQERPQWQRGWFGIDTLNNGQLDRILGILARHEVKVKRYRGWHHASIDKDVLPQIARDVRQAMADMEMRQRIDGKIDALPKNGHSASISGDLVTIEDHGGGISPAAMTFTRQLAVKQHAELAVV